MFDSVRKMYDSFRFRLFVCPLPPPPPTLLCGHLVSRRDIYSSYVSHIYKYNCSFPSRKILFKSIGGGGGGEGGGEFHRVRTNPPFCKPTERFFRFCCHALRWGGGGVMPCESSSCRVYDYLTSSCTAHALKHAACTRVD